MSELELALTRLGRELDYPETPDLTGVVRRRLAEARPPRAWRRPVVIALAALLVVVAAVMAVPQARSEILDWLGIGSVTIRHVDDLPKVEKTTPDLELGSRSTLREARARVPFSVQLPTIQGFGDPQVYFRSGAGQVSFLYGSTEEPRLLISQLLSAGAIDKLVGGGTTVETLSIGDARAVWLEGAGHVLYIPGLGEEPQRLAGNTLIVQRADNVTVRIEADVSKDEAVEIFRSMEPSS
jgi:hypothetical protein